MFGKMIRQRLLENPHRLLGVFPPDPELAAKNQAEFTRIMAARKAKLSTDDLRSIGSVAAKLEAAQGKPNSPEALATLPQLKASDLPRKPRHIPTTIEKLGTGVELLRNDVFANGVSYLQLDFDLEGLPLELYAELPRYAATFSKLGAAGQPYTRIAQRRAAHTGGVGCGHSFYTHAVNPVPLLRRMRVSLKTLDGQVDPALALLHDLLFALDPRDPEPAARRYHSNPGPILRTSMVTNGQGTALSHATRGISPVAALHEEVDGLPQLARVERLADQFDQEADGLITRIEAIRDFLLNRRRVTASFTGSDQAYERVRAQLESWTGAMRDEPMRNLPIPFHPYAAPPREGLAGPMEVAYCTMAMPAPHASHPSSPQLDLAARFMSLDYVLTEVRFKGNAYGAGCYYSEANGTFGFTSYRDPRLTQTLAVFTGLRDYVRAAQWTQTGTSTARSSARAKPPSGRSGPAKPQTPPWAGTSAASPAKAARTALRCHVGRHAGFSKASVGGAVGYELQPQRRLRGFQPGKA